MKFQPEILYSLYGKATIEYIFSNRLKSIDNSIETWDLYMPMFLFQLDFISSESGMSSLSTEWLSSSDHKLSYL